MPKEPEAVRIATGYLFTWPDLGIRVEVERLREDSHRVVSGEISLNYKNELLEQTRLNLLSSNARNSLAKSLAERVNSQDWHSIVKSSCLLSLEKYRLGEPIEEVWPTEKGSLAPEYLLEPLLYLNHPAVIFGDYGSGKSIFALAVAYLAQLPFKDNGLGFITREESTPALYLDYEDDLSNFKRRWSALEQGFKQGAHPIIYRRMASPLADDVERIGALIAEKGIKLLVIDSLGPAAGGNLSEPQPAILYHGALRQLGITSLSLAHNAKDPLTKRRSIFGSVFFTNLARIVWECRSEQEAGEDEIIISLKNVKANLSKLHLPLGFKFSFRDQAIELETADLKHTGLSGELPLSMQIKNLLAGGSMTLKDIAETLEHREPSIRTVLNRLKKKQVLVKVGEEWGLSTQEAML